MHQVQRLPRPVELTACRAKRSAIASLATTGRLPYTEIVADAGRRSRRSPDAGTMRTLTDGRAARKPVRT